MTHPTPILSLHEQADALLSPYGPEDDPVQVPQIFTSLPLEYSAIRRAAAMLDQPTRAVLEITGEGRVDFLTRMVTQDLSGFDAYTGRRSFWLNRKGRIDADLRLINLPDKLLVDLDVHAAARAVQGLVSYIIVEDVAIRDVTDSMHRLALHGPAAPALLQRASDHAAGARPDTAEPGQAGIVRIADAEVVFDRQDSTGEPGLELFVPAPHAEDVYRALTDLDDAIPEDAESLEGRGLNRRNAPKSALARRIGWAAYNIARIEAGWPLYYLDFGPDSLPHETGVLYDRVNFKKGCYLGQEVVARMESRGHSKARLAALTISSEAGPEGVPLQPVTGDAVLASTSPDAETVGAVTSSAVSPLLGSVPICFAVVKPAFIKPGQRLGVRAEGAIVSATVNESLSFRAKHASSRGKQ